MCFRIINNFKQSVFVIKIRFLQKVSLIIKYFQFMQNQNSNQDTQQAQSNQQTANRIQMLQSQTEPVDIQQIQAQVDAHAQQLNTNNDNKEMMQVEGLGEIPLDLQGLTAEQFEQLQQINLQQQQELGQLEQQQLIDQDFLMQLNNMGLNQEQYNELIQQQNQLEMLKQIDPNLIQNGELDIFQDKQLQEQLQLLKQEQNGEEPNLEQIQMLLQYQRMQNAHNQGNPEPIQESLAKDNNQEIIDLQNQIEALKQQQANEALENAAQANDQMPYDIDLNSMDAVKLTQIVANLGYNCTVDDLNRLDPFTLKQLLLLQNMEQNKGNEDEMKIKILMQQYPDLLPEQIQAIIDQDKGDQNLLDILKQNEIQNQIDMLNAQNQSQGQMLQPSDLFQANQFNQQQLQEANLLSQAQQLKLQDSNRKPTGAEDEREAASNGRFSMNSSERQKAFEKQKDKMFEDKLWVFYKNMRERLSAAQLEKITKKQNQFCEHMDKITADYKKSKQDKGAKESEDGNSKSDEDFFENQCNDSTFQEIFYGPNSSLDPDQFIKFVLQTLSEHKDLSKEFRRFLPEDLDDEDQSAERKFQQFVESMNFDNGAALLNLDDQTNPNKDQLIQRLKSVAQMRLLELLKEYTDAKLNGSPREALENYTDKIMEIAESYHQYLSTDTQNKFQFDQKDPIQGLSKIDSHEYQMNMILEMIPHEIIENYKFINPEMGDIEGKLRMKNTTKKDSKRGDKSKGRSRGKNLKPHDESFVSSSKLESSDVEENKLHMVNDGSQFENSESGENDSNQQESGENEQSEDSQDQNQENDDSVKESDSQDGRRKGEETETISEQNASDPKLSKKQIQQIYELPLFKNTNKQELAVFQNLHQSMRSDSDWNEFNKLFRLYLDGIISIEQFFLLFDDRFGYRLSENLKEELKILLPTRDHSRRCQSNILKPWNDLENQKFEKIPESSYYKIDQFFQLPICSAKMDPKNGTFYQGFLNEKYLMLSLGSESFGFKVRNQNEDLIFKNEDNMYKLDTQIEMYAKCHQIVENEKTSYDKQILKDPKFADRYVFPKHKFSPMIYYWEEKSQQTLLAIMDAKPFQRECLNILADGLGRKMQHLFNEKYNELGAFEDVYRKNFKKSLDHRSFQYKEFIKKFQQKHYHMNAIKQQAQDNQLKQFIPDTIIKGGNYSCSEFYHTFGPFIYQDFELFDGHSKINDFPIDMRYSESVIQKYQEKLPHQRLLFNDQEAKSIAIKILLLQIKYSTNHHNSESRQKILDIIGQILQNFMNVDNFQQLNDQCAEGQIESLTPAQIDLIMNQDSHLYYKKGLEQNSQKDGAQKPVKIQIQDVTRVVTAEELLQNKSEQSEKEESPSEKEEKSLTAAKETSLQSPVKIYQRFDEIKFNKDVIGSQEEAQVAEKSLFLPHIPQEKQDKYNLMYAPSNLFMFITVFYSLYERILKAKSLISQKIKQDMAEMEGADKFTQKSKLQSEEMQKTFAKERYEHLLKAIFATTTQQAQTGSTNITSLSMAGGYSSHLLMDHNRYEDFARQLLGQNAFLLFQIDKIVSVAIKQLQHMNTDAMFQKSMKLFDNMQECETKSDSNYLVKYASQIIFDQQISLKELQNQPQPINLPMNGCIHNVSQHDEPEGLDNDKGLKVDDKNKDNQANLSASAAAQQQSNFQAFRLQWSNQSQILSIHFVNFNPFQIQTSGLKNFKKLMTDNFVQMRTHTVQPLARNPNSKDGGCSSCLSRFNKLDQYGKVSPPIFLKKNLRQMTRKRDAKMVSKQNGLTHRILPALGNIAFDSQTEDTLNITRKQNVNVSEEFKHELERSKRATEIRNKRLQQIMQQTLEDKTKGNYKKQSI